MHRLEICPEKRTQLKMRCVFSTTIATTARSIDDANTGLPASAFAPPRHKLFAEDTHRARPPRFMHIDPSSLYPQGWATGMESCARMTWSRLSLQIP
jgi:hypothetical protein